MLRLVTAPTRLPRPSRTLLLVTGVWLTLVGLTLLLARLRGVTVELCPFRYVSGIPCPTCGSGRASLHLLYGELVSAFLSNPLFVAALGGLFLQFVLQLAFKYRLALTLGRRWGWLLFIGLLGGNWLFLLFSPHVHSPMAVP
jgi:hypothetical protein